MIISVRLKTERQADTELRINELPFDHLTQPSPSCLQELSYRHLVRQETRKGAVLNEDIESRLGLICPGQSGGVCL